VPTDTKKCITDKQLQVRMHASESIVLKSNSSPKGFGCIAEIKRRAPLFFACYCALWDCTKRAGEAMQTIPRLLIANQGNDA